ncbi:uncharacterized protein LOC121734377 [Aricia agestis]|uniref:uncharacterized protein LOC121734377 n=1 Tax=Aricia agestis TaxID=91739 RepID=UPI001C20272E|nr:uncharacterized protein LOC121734377 [Aricia agestis]
MNRSLQVVPWFNKKEWCEVYEHLFSTESTILLKKRAIDVLHVWKARCPFVPSGIESTLCLLEVHIQDEEGICYENSDQLLRLAYATALMRFVNHMLDKETAKGTGLYKAAKNLGVPDWIVDLRHDTAHNNKLPSIDLLREACVVSLDWLKVNYWDKHKDAISDYVADPKASKVPSDENKIVPLLNFCTSLSILSHSSCMVKNVAQIRDSSMRESLINDAIELFGNDLDFSNPKKVSIAGLSNSMYSKAKQLLNNESALYVNKTLLSEDSLFLSLEVYKVFQTSSNKKNQQLSNNYLQCFEGLINFLHTHDLLQDFILQLIDITCQDKNGSRCKLAAQWVAVILEALLKCQSFLIKLKNKSSNVISKDEDELKSFYYHWYPSEKNKCLLINLSKPIPKNLTNINFIQPIVSTYNPYLTYFVNPLLGLVRPQIPSEISEKICNLATLIAFPGRFSVVSSKIYTAEDIKNNSDNCSNNFSDNANAMDVDEISKFHEDSIWQLAPQDCDWTTCPIGLLPWQYQGTGSEEKL